VGIRLGIVLLLISVVLGVAGVVQAVRVAVVVFDAPVADVPGTLTATLDLGTHNVYARSGIITSSDVRVTAPGGSSVVTSNPTVNETITRGSVTYTGVAQFEAEDAGSYTITITDVPATQVIVAPSLGEVAVRAGIWVLGMVLGGLLFVVGLILLIVGLVRRSRARRGPPPGAYTDPGYGSPGAT
jgi:predicted heme/steroid binding protein